jgi:hypothetical protein
MDCSVIHRKIHRTQRKKNTEQFWDLSTTTNQLSLVSFVRIRTCVSGALREDRDSILLAIVRTCQVMLVRHVVKLRPWDPMWKTFFLEIWAICICGHFRTLQLQHVLTVDMSSGKSVDKCPVRGHVADMFRTNDTKQLRLLKQQRRTNESASASKRIHRGCSC